MCVCMCTYVYMYVYVHRFVRAYVSPRAMRLGFVRANDVAMLALDAFVYCIVPVNIAVLCRQYTCMHRHIYTQIYTYT